MFVLFAIALFLEVSLFFFYGPAAFALLGMLFFQAAKTDQVYTAGGDVKPPKVIKYVEPEFSESSQEAYVEGKVRLSAVVDTEGLPTDLKVVSGLNADEDKTAVAALKQWRFKPGTKNGQVVRVRITVEINFHLL